MESHLWIQSLRNERTLCHAFVDSSLETNFGELVKQVEHKNDGARGIISPMGTCFAVLQAASEVDCEELCRLSHSAGLRGVWPLRCIFVSVSREFTLTRMLKTWDCNRDPGCERVRFVGV